MFFVWGNIYVNILNYYYIYDYNFMTYVAIFVPTFFYTLLLWNEKLRRNIANTFINSRLNKKEIKTRFVSKANYLSEYSKVSSKSRKVQTNISDADEIKKYSELRDQGIITEEEFQAKKKKLLDL